MTRRITYPSTWKWFLIWIVKQDLDLVQALKILNSLYFTQIGFSCEDPPCKNLFAIYLYSCIKSSHPNNMKFSKGFLYLQMEPVAACSLKVMEPTSLTTP